MPRPLTARTVLWIGIPALLFAASCGAAVGAVRLARADGDRVEILGSGDSVSILVSTGRSEMLIATGTDRTAFGNAYDRVSLARRSQPDVLVVAGSDRSLNVPTLALDWFADATTFAIHPLQAGSTGDADLGELAPLPISPIRFTLDGRIVAVVETRAVEEDGGAGAWRAMIVRGDSRVAVLSALEHADQFAWTEPVSALIVAGETKIPDDIPVETNAIIGSAVTLSPPDKAGGTDSAGDEPEHMVPVRPGSVATVTFADSGVKLTSDDRMYSTGHSD